jgi:hypothetical protein
MKRLAIILSAFLTSCVHIDHTTTNAVNGVLLAENGRPIFGAQIWAVFLLPGGLFSAKQHVAFGPAITRHDGSFSVRLHSVSMIHTGTIFDGRTSPSLLIMHRNYGAFSIFSTTDEEEWPFQRIVWEDPTKEQRFRDEVIADMIAELPEADRKVARKALNTP